MRHKRAQTEKNSRKIREVIISGALNIASRSPWEFVSLLEVADSAGLKMEDILVRFPDKSAILSAIMDDLDHQVEEFCAVPDQSTPVRDRLFDVLMERIERANDHRDAHISFFKSFGWTKNAACQDMALMKRSMTRMAKLAGMDVDGMFGSIKLTGLTLSYVWVLLTWTQDSSPDLGKTMSELDRILGRAERVYTYFKT